MDREDRLPKWARDELSLLRRRVDELTRDRDALYSDEPTETQGLTGLDTEFPLPPGSSVRFGCSRATARNGHVYTDYVFEARRAADGALEVSVRDGRILTRAQSSNRIDILNVDMFGRDR